MTDSLLATKFYIPPIRRQLVARPRLVQRLEASLAYPLVLISAPPGFGKSTLLAEWVQSDPKVRVAWVSLDAGDNDPTRFWTYVGAALRKAATSQGDSFGQTLALLGAKPPLPAETVLTSLINEAAALSEAVVLVLDDYHSIDASEVQSGMAYLVEHLPPALHVIIATRTDPPLPLPRLRARGLLAEIRGADLRFTAEEATVFLNQVMGLSLAQDSIDVLEERTEGWIAGLQLAALTVQGRDAASTARFIDGFSGRHHFVLDYLADEVLQHQPPAVQTFLLYTSILDRLCAGLSAAVLETADSGPESGERRAEAGSEEGAEMRPEPAQAGQPAAGVVQSPATQPPFPGSQTILDYLEHANLFVVPLDNERQWYRYHHLFAELLQARLHETQPKIVPELHRRAALWYEANGLAPEGVQHALAGRDFDLAADMLVRSIRSGSIVWSTGELARLLAWLRSLPDEVVRRKPWLRIYVSRVLSGAGQMQEAERVLAELEESLADLRGRDPETDRLMGLVWGTSATYAALRGDVALALTKSQRALARLPQDYLMARSHTGAGFGLAHLLMGDVKVAEQLCRQAQADALTAGVPFSAIGAMYYLGEVLLAQGRLRDAAQLCEEALTLGAPVERTAARQSPDLQSPVLGTPVLRLPAAGILPVAGSMPAAGLAGLVLGQVLYEWNDLSAAERCLTQSLELLRRGDITDYFGLGRALLGRVRQALGDRAGASAALAQALDAARASGYGRYVNLIGAYQARAWLASGDVASATGWAEGYRQSEPPAHLRPFEDLTLARVWLAQGRPGEALAISRALLPSALAAGRNGHAIDGLVVQALALAAEPGVSCQADSSSSRPPAANARTAGDALSQALALAAPEGYKRVFLDEGDTLRLLLRDLPHAPDAQPVSAHVTSLLPAFSAGAQPTHPVPVLQPGPTGLLDPLTARETEILGLLARGLSNREIAARLYLSPNTLRAYTYSIYSKMAVHSRMQAVLRARELGVLPPEA